MNIVLIGVQGCGKGTLVAGLEKHLDFSLISMGQLLRDEVKTGSELGKKIKEKQEAGMLVDIDIVTAVLKKNLENDTKEFRIFDGFPRNAEQADELDKVTKVDLVINLNLPIEIAVERLLSRLTCEKCGFVTNKKYTNSTICPQCGGKLATRKDDNLEAINKRFKVFNMETFPLLERYEKQGVRVVTIDSIDAEETLNKVLKVINEHKN